MAAMATFDALIPFYELPAPVIETYRIRQISPRMSIDLEVDYQESDDEMNDARVKDTAPRSDRPHRARCWTSDDDMG
jgi:hypothetical protein